MDDVYVTIINSIPVCEGGVECRHEAFIFLLLLSTKEEYTQFLPDDLFQNKCSNENNISIHDLERLGSLSSKLPFGGLWIFYESDCLVKGINLLHELNDTFVMKLMYGGKVKQGKNWIVKTPIIMTEEDKIRHEQAT